MKLSGLVSENIKFQQMYNRPSMLLVLILVSIFCAPLSAQWFNYPTPGIPRAADGKPNLSAPAPRTADGKPDLSGVWSGPGPGSYDRNVARDLSPKDVQPWAEALYQQRVRDMGFDKASRARDQNHGVASLRPMLT